MECSFAELILLWVDEMGKLLDPGEGDVAVLPQVLVQTGRPAFLRTDNEQVDFTH